MSLSVLGVDYAWGHPSPKALKARCDFVMRYLSYDASKNLTATERASLHAAGLGVGVVWETAANRALSGFPAGRADAQSARTQANAAGLQGAPIYFAVDFDASETQKPVIGAYLRGAASVLGHDRVGVYGGYWVVKYASDHNACKWLWQTYAWSGGRVHPQTHIFQYKNGVSIDGVSCDLDKAQPVAGIVYPAKPVNVKAVKAARKRRLWRKHLATAVKRVAMLKHLLKRKH